MEQKDINQIIHRILNGEIEFDTDLQTTLHKFLVYDILTEEEKKSIQMIDVDKVRTFLESSQERRSNNFCCIQEHAR